MEEAIRRCSSLLMSATGFNGMKAISRRFSRTEPIQWLEQNRRLPFDLDYLQLSAPGRDGYCAPHEADATNAIVDILSMAISKYRRAFLLSLALAASSAVAADNPMWRFGLDWDCAYTQVAVCEREAPCTTRATSGVVSVHYADNKVISSDGSPMAIRRHYVQAVAGSPIASEIKIELENNETLWLNPADASGIYSKYWLGVLMSPKGGVVISEMRPLICSPAS
jgi:hypothetical protein